MLTVVDNHHDGMIGERRTNACHHVGVWFDLHTECRCERRWDQLDVTDWGEIDEERAVGEAPDCLRSEFDGEAGLADPADPGERDQPIAQTQDFQRGELELSADDRAHFGRQVRRTQTGRCRNRRQQPRVVGEDRLLQFLQRRSRLESEFGAEQHPDATVSAKGVGGAARLVQGEHQQTPGGLSVRVVLQERLQLADASLPAAKCQFGLDRLLEYGRLQLVESMHLPCGQSGLGHVRIGFTAERRGRVAQQADSATRIATTDCLSRLGDKLADPSRVHMDTVGVEPVAATLLDDGFCTEHPPQPHDVPLQRLARSIRPPPRPQRLLQHIGRDPFADPGRQCRQQRPFRSRQPDNRAPVDQLHRAQDPNLHRCRP